MNTNEFQHFRYFKMALFELFSCFYKKKKTIFSTGRTLPLYKHPIDKIIFTNYYINPIYLSQNTHKILIFEIN